MPFQLGGGGSNSGSSREAHQRTLAYALGNAAREKAKKDDTGDFAGPGVMTRSGGLPRKPQSSTFNKNAGPSGPFARETGDPDNEEHFNRFMGGLASFRDFMNPPQGPLA